MGNKLSTIEIIVKELKTKEGKPFTAYKAVQKNGRLMDCSFTRAVTNLPKEDCYINVTRDNWNVDYNRKYPKLWVKKIESISKITTKTQQNVNDEDLPF